MRSFIHYLFISNWIWNSIFLKMYVLNHTAFCCFHIFMKLEALGERMFMSMFAYVQPFRQNFITDKHSFSASFSLSSSLLCSKSWKSSSECFFFMIYYNTKMLKHNLYKYNGTASVYICVTLDYFYFLSSFKSWFEANLICKNEVSSVKPNRLVKSAEACDWTSLNCDVLWLNFRSQDMRVLKKTDRDLWK